MNLKQFFERTKSSVEQKKKEAGERAERFIKEHPESSRCPATKADLYILAGAMTAEIYASVEALLELSAERDGKKDSENTFSHVKAISRLNALEESVTELQANPLEYHGVHESGRCYARNAFVTHGGSLWAALRPTSERPGQSRDWQLAVKRGKDAA